jgi:hypothetical protein
MHLKLNLNGSVDPFVNYLKNFAKIRPSLLIEIDTNERAFVAKTFTEDRGSVRFSAIGFNKCNMTIVENTGENTLGKERIKAGILIQLPRLIKIIEQFGANLDKDGNATFDITFEYDTLVNKNGATDYVVTMITFTSKSLKMKLDGFRISELTYLSDDKFNNVVFNVQDAVKFKLTSDMISSIIKTSDIVKLDGKKDALTFYVDGNNLYVKDLVSKGESNFVYLLGTLSDTVDYAISATVFREKFIQMMDKSNENYDIILGRRPTADGKYVVDRILFDSTDSNTKIVISIVNN